MVCATNVKYRSSTGRRDTGATFGSACDDDDDDPVERLAVCRLQWRRDGRGGKRAPRRGVALAPLFNCGYGGGGDADGRGNAHETWACPPIGRQDPVEHRPLVAGRRHRRRRRRPPTAALARVQSLHSRSRTVRTHCPFQYNRPATPSPCNDFWFIIIVFFFSFCNSIFIPMVYACTRTDRTCTVFVFA